MSNNKEVQVTLFYWKKVIIVAERKHQSVGSKKFRVETQLQKKPMIIFTHTIVNPHIWKALSTSQRKSMDAIGLQLTTTRCGRKSRWQSPRFIGMETGTKE